QGGSFFILVEGKKSILNRKSNQGRLFQEAGLKLLLLLISNPELLTKSYRYLAEKTNISLGAVSIVFNELEAQHFLIRDGKQRVLKNKSELLSRWVQGYSEIIKPKIFKKRMRTIGNESIMQRAKDNPDLEIYCGGEIGGHILTNHLISQNVVLYSNDDHHMLGKRLLLVPDDQGNVEIRSRFWSDEVNVAGDNLAPK